MADVAWFYYSILDIEIGAFFVGAAIHELSGVSILFILKYVYPFLFSFQILFMYLVVKSLTENSMASALSSAYIALSPAQYHLSEAKRSVDLARDLNWGATKGSDQ